MNPSSDNMTKMKKNNKILKIKIRKINKIIEAIQIVVFQKNNQNCDQIV